MSIFEFIFQNVKESIFKFMAFLNLILWNFHKMMLEIELVTYNVYVTETVMMIIIHGEISMSEKHFLLGDFSFFFFANSISEEIDFFPFVFPPGLNTDL